MTEQLKTLTFIPFDPAYRGAFYDLNKAWLEAHFLLEPDRQIRLLRILL